MKARSRRSRRNAPNDPRPTGVKARTGRCLQPNIRQTDPQPGTAALSA